MICPKCEYENRPDARFCKKCGSILSGQIEAVGEPSGQLLATLNAFTHYVGTLRDSILYLGSSAERISNSAITSTGGLQDIRGLLDDMSKRFDVITNNLQEATGNASDYSRLSKETMDSLNQVEKSLIPTLEAFSKQTTLATKRLTKAIDSLEQAVGQRQSERPLWQWLLIVYLAVVLTAMLFK